MFYCLLSQLLICWFFVCFVFCCLFYAECNIMYIVIVVLQLVKLFQKKNM
jgi:hypothetical protein